MTEPHRNTTLKLLTIGLACSVVSFSPVAPMAQQVTTDRQTEVVYEGSRIRVNLSSSLRSVAETISASACTVSAGWDVENATQRLGEAQAEFDAILNALLFGNVNLGVPSRERASRVRLGLQELQQIWIPTSVLSIKLAQDPSRSDLSNQIGSNRTTLETATQRLSEEMIAEYVSTSDLLVADALTASIAGRQLKLLREIETLACATLSDQPVFGNQERLSARIERFELTLNALMSGLEKAGVAPPPTEELSQLLASINTNWQKQKAVIASLTSTQLEEEQAWLDLRAGFDSLFNDMLQAVSLYSREAEGSEEATRRAVLNFADQELARWMRYREFRNVLVEGEVDHAQWLMDLMVANSRGLVISAALVDRSGKKVIETKDPLAILPDLAGTAATVTQMSEPAWDPVNQRFVSQVVVSSDDNPDIRLIADVNVVPFM